MHSTPRRFRVGEAADPAVGPRRFLATATAYASVVSRGGVAARGGGPDAGGDSRVAPGGGPCPPAAASRAADWTAGPAGWSRV